MNHILVEDNRDMSMPSDMSLFLYIRISGRDVYSERICDRQVDDRMIRDRKLYDNKKDLKSYDSKSF